MQTRQQILSKLKDRNLTHEQRERLHQHLFHLDQQSQANKPNKREASAQNKNDPSKPTPTET